MYLSHKSQNSCPLKDQNKSLITSRTKNTKRKMYKIINPESLKIIKKVISIPVTAKAETPVNNALAAPNTKMSSIRNIYTFWTKSNSLTLNKTLKDLVQTKINCPKRQKAWYDCQNLLKRMLFNLKNRSFAEKATVQAETILKEWKEPTLTM